MCRARRKCGKNMLHNARSEAENAGEDLGRVMRKRSLPPSGVEISAPITWYTFCGPQYALKYADATQSASLIKSSTVNT